MGKQASERPALGGNCCFSIFDEDGHLDMKLEVGLCDEQGQWLAAVKLAEAQAEVALPVTTVQPDSWLPAGDDDFSAVLCVDQHQPDQCDPHLLLLGSGLFHDTYFSS